MITVLVAAVGGMIWWWMGRPFYEPGSLANTRIVSFKPTSEADPNRAWETEDGVKIHHFATGEGAPVIVLHGGPGHPFIEPIAALEPLGVSYRFIYYDQRGCGRSSRPVVRPVGDSPYAQMQDLDRQLGLAAQLADIERVRRAVVNGTDEPVVLLGHSYGGFLAALYAAEFPERVRGLILVAPANLLLLPGEGPDLFDLVGQRQEPSTRVAYRKFAAEYLDFPRLLERTDDEMREFNNTFADYFGKAIGVDALLSGPDRAATGGWMTHAQYLSMGRRHDYRGALRQVSAPVLILHGDRDLVPSSACEAYQRALSDVRVEVVVGAGHQVFADQPELFRAAVEAFLATLR